MRTQIDSLRSLPDYKAHHIRGMLLEEAIFELLRRTGFLPIDKAGTDQTLRDGDAGLYVQGRGSEHQIDVIGDYPLTMPFSHPARLLIEAKFYGKNRKVGLAVVRNSYGVLRDVSEYFVPGDTPSRRYHYQAAVFAATDFSPKSQSYAFAHDIYLVPLRRNGAFSPIIVSVETIESAAGPRAQGLELKDIRFKTRNFLRRIGELDEMSTYLGPALLAIRSALEQIGSAYIARTTNGFPLFLLPLQTDSFESVSSQRTMRVRVRNLRSKGWFLETHDGHHRQPLFSFDLPRELFDIYQREGRLTSRAMSAMKQAEFEKIFAFRVRDDGVEVVTMQLDREWISDVQRLSETPEDDE